MTNQEKMVTWGLLAFIAYELWGCSSAPTLKRVTSIDNQIPEWVKELSMRRQQLSGATKIVDFFNRPCGTGWR